MPFSDEITNDRQRKALLRYHYRIDPNTLTVDEYAKLWCEYVFAKNWDGVKFKER